MGWDGDSRNYHFCVKATRRQYLEEMVSVIQSKSKEKLQLDIVEQNLTKSIKYYEFNFSDDELELLDVLDPIRLKKIYPEFVFIDNLLPFYTVRIEMVIVTSNFNEYTHKTTDKYSYLCSRPSIAKT